MRDDDRIHGDEVLDGELVEHSAPAPVRHDTTPGRAPLSPPDGPNAGLDWVRTPAAQNALAAATGFMAGAATLALARRYGRARLERALASASNGPALTAGAQRGPGRTYLVHVRPLGGEPGAGFPTLGPGSSSE